MSDDHEHTWVRCAQCPNAGKPCACAGGICCVAEIAENITEQNRTADIVDLPASMLQPVSFDDTPEDETSCRYVEFVPADESGDVW